MDTFLERRFPGERQLLWEKRTYFGHLICLRHYGKVWVMKQLTHHALLEAAKPLEVGQLWNDYTLAFGQGLLRLGVPVAEVYEVHTSPEGFFHVISYEGVDFREQAYARADDGQFGSFLLRKILQAIEGVLLQEDPVVGVDPRYSNFAGSLEGRLSYVDLFPPLVRLDEGYIVHFPQPWTLAAVQKEVHRKFAPEGILRRLLMETLFVNPRWESFLMEAIKEVFESSEAWLGYLRAVPDRQILQNPGRAAEMICALPHDDRDTLRALAARLSVSLGPERERFLRAAFALPREGPAGRSAWFPQPTYEERVELGLKPWLICHL